MDFVEKFDEKAQEVLQAQKLHLLEVIEKLKPKSSQLWGHYDNGQWIDGDGDIDAHHLRRYAPSQWRELDSSIKDVQIAWKLETRNWVTYSIYRQVELSLRKCIRLGFATIELALDKRESKELSTLRTATILLLLWPLVITHIASFAIWDWGAARPGSPRKLVSQKVFRKDILPSMLARAEEIANERARAQVGQAASAAEKSLTAEIERLRDLAQRNNHISPSEIESLTHHRDEITRLLSQSRVRLDALRLIWRTPG